MCILMFLFILSVSLTPGKFLWQFFAFYLLSHPGAKLSHAFFYGFRLAAQNFEQQAAL